MIKTASLFVFSASLLACAHSPSPAEEGLAATEAQSDLNQGDETGAAPQMAEPEQGPARRPQDRCTSMTSENAVKRAAVAEVVDAGLGFWLQGVQVERVLEKRKFQGWRVQALHLTNPCYANVDLRPGDVVTAINGQGPKQLEKPDTAQVVFNSLKAAPAIEVSYVRDGQPRSLRIAIVEAEAR